MREAFCLSTQPCYNEPVKFPSLQCFLFLNADTMKIRNLLAFLLIFLLLPSSVFALALRCGNKLVDVGDRKIEVVQQCGEPAIIEKWRVESTTATALRSKQYPEGEFSVKDENQEVKTEMIEEWTYNFGPNKFMHFLTFTNGVLTRIEVGERGFSGKFPADIDKTRCGKRVALEDRKIDVIMKCGEPVFEETRVEEKIASKSLGRQTMDASRSPDEKQGDDAGGKLTIEQSMDFQEKRLFVNVTDWSYNFGPNQFLLFITFENGRVTKVEQGDYGYE